MTKIDEVSSFESCLNKAKDNEMLFVLRAHDITAPIVIRHWVDERIRLGKNKVGDPELVDALKCAAIMEDQRNRGVV